MLNLLIKSILFEKCILINVSHFTESLMTAKHQFPRYNQMKNIT